MCVTVILLVLFAAPVASETTELPTAAEGAPIGTVTIQRQNVFDTSKPGEDNAFFRLVNRLHIVTREKVIVKQLLFAAGEPYSKQLIEESERGLRRNRYLYDVSISAAPQDDGTVDIEVDTRDVWTLFPEISISRSGGENKTILGIEEKNLFGYGQRVLLTHSEDVDRRSNLFEFSDRQLGQSWVSVALRIADNSDGHSKLLSIAKPFHALDARWMAGGFVFDDDRRSTLYILGDEAAEYRHERTNFSAFGGWSSGLRDGWVKRWTFGGVYDENLFSAVENPTLPAAIPADRKLVYPFIGIDILEDRFEKSTNTNQIERSEDFYFGTRLAASLGWSDTRFDADRDALIYTLTGNAAFGSMDRKALLLTANIRGRREDGTTANLTATVIARYYSRQSEKRMFFARFSATAGQNLDLDNPIEIGGDTGLRGYPLRYQTGDGRVLVTVEQRYFTDWYPFRLFRIGGAVFFDVGRTYGDDPLGGPNLGWLKDIGFGFRFAPTRFGTRKVIHLDVAFPLDGDPTIDSVQISLEAKRSF
jgi:hypothetical protein